MELLFLEINKLSRIVVFESNEKLKKRSTLISCWLTSKMTQSARWKQKIFFFPKEMENTLSLTPYSKLPPPWTCVLSCVTEPLPQPLIFYTEVPMQVEIFFSMVRRNYHGTTTQHHPIFSTKEKKQTEMFVSDDFLRHETCSLKLFV